MGRSPVMVVRSCAAGKAHHGGWRRSRQIDELLASAGLAAEVCTLHPDRGFDPRGLKDIVAVGPRAWNWSNLVAATARSHGLRSALRQRRAALVEMPHNAVIERVTADRCEVRIAVPHNVESFNEHRVRSWRARDPVARVAVEVQMLRRYDAVFTIAIEEYWLMANAGLDAHFLPYTPPRETMTWLESLRVARAASAPRGGNDVVVLGTAQVRHAEATVRLVQVLHAAGIRPVVVGYNTTALSSRLGCQADVRGAVSEEALFTLLARCRAVAIHQTGGGGALTRIVELGHAGVPVVAAGVAGRSMHGWRHLTWVHDVGDIPAVLPEPGTTVTAVDPWQAMRQAAERRMVAWLGG